jgi:hypothetical protein
MLYAPTAPEIDEPLDISYAEGTIGHEIVWYPKDDYLRNWTATIDGENWARNSWNYDNVTVNVDGLAYGLHTLILTVYDMQGASVSDEVLIDVYDVTPPSMSSEADVTIFDDDVVEWSVADLNPGIYEVYIDGEYSQLGAWETGVLEIDVYLLEPRVYEYQIVVYDLDGNFAADTILVLCVSDTDSPGINSPPDVVYTERSTGNSIVWTPTDEYPASYDMTHEGAVVASGQWRGSRIVFNIDDLEPGETYFVLTVYDQAGNSVSDRVDVVVLAVEPQITTTPVDLTLPMIAAALGITIIVVVVIALFVRRKR